MPTSFDIVSQETKELVTKWKVQVENHLTGWNFPFGEIPGIIKNLEKRALDLTLKVSVEDWENGRKPCSAEQFVQRFLRLMWDDATCDGGGPFPCALTAPSVGPPLSPEFLEAIQMTEEAVLVSAKTATSPSRMPTAAAAPPNPPTQKGESMKPDGPSNPGKRKNNEPEAHPRKHGRGNDGQRMPPRSPSPDGTQVQWSGVSLTDKQAKLMNTNLMNVIWNTQISENLKADHGAGVFEVRIPKGDAWLLLGRDIRRVFELMRGWRPIRLHTFDSGPFLHVGLWVRKNQTHGQKGRDMYYAMADLFSVLTQWPLRAFTAGKAKAVSLADFLADHLGA